MKNVNDFFFEQITPNRQLPFRLLIHDAGTAHTVLPHWHKSFELDYVLHGVNTNFTVQDDLFDQSETELVVVNPYEVHSLQLADDSARIAMTIMLPDAFMISCGISAGTCRFVNRIKHNPSVSYCFEQLYRLSKQSETSGRRAALIATTYQLVAILLDHYAVMQSVQSQKRITAQLSHLTPALTWLEKHYAETVTVESLAQVSNLSVSYFAHLFKTYMRQSPLVYVTNLRLTASQKLLLTTDESIENVAIEAGFVSRKAFTKAFRESFGVSPRQYRIEQSRQ